jgi:hypothetical protein
MTAEETCLFQGIERSKILQQGTLPEIFCVLFIVWREKYLGEIIKAFLFKQCAILPISEKKITHTTC